MVWCHHVWAILTKIYIAIWHYTAKMSQVKRKFDSDLSNTIIVIRTISYNVRWHYWNQFSNSSISFKWKLNTIAENVWYISQSAIEQQKPHTSLLIRYIVVACHASNVLGCPGCRHVIGNMGFRLLEPKLVSSHKTCQTYHHMSFT